MILAADIGGTKTHLVLYDQSKEMREIKNQKFPSKEFANLSQIIHAFLSDQKVVIGRACFGVAGPVEHNVCHATNLPWVIDAAIISKELHIPQVWLINDLEANAYGLKCLKTEEFLTLNEGIEQEGNQALIAAGTGLGEAGLYWNGQKHSPFACEGGHVDFAPRDELEMELFRYLKKKFEHVSYERILSGSGLYLMYRFLVDMRLEKEGEGSKQEFFQKDPARVITERALKNQDQGCIRALEWFVSIYGAETGNLALKFLALGGVFIGGGIAPKILRFMQAKPFIKSFVSKGRFAALLSTIPVKIILNDNAALLGAAKYAKEHE